MDIDLKVGKLLPIIHGAKCVKDVTIPIMTFMMTMAEGVLKSVVNGTVLVNFWKIWAKDLMAIL